MIECASCGTVAVVLDRSGASDVDDELVVVCAECAPDEVSAVLEASLLESARVESTRVESMRIESTLLEAAPVEAGLARSAHARAA